MRQFISFLFVIVFSIFVYNCNTDSDGVGTDGSMGKLNIYLTDTPAAYDSVNIVFTEVSAHLDSEWVSVTQEPTRVNLLDWSNGRTMLLGSEEVPAGKYTQIRIKIDSASIVVDGDPYPLVVPSGAQTGLKFGPEFTIAAGSTYELVVDFDASRSVVTTGPPNDPKGYKLKPHIRVTTNAVTGSISGTVTNHDDMPMAYAITSDDDTLTMAIADTSSGYFMLGFLPEASYKVFVTDTIGLTFEQENVMVTKGQNNNIGSITLQ
jgi:hypothetical protein